ncbi:MAG: hypothetical protein A2817_01155 [Candidatus Yanofskybacteria bacterium RIFCSPHIGHO2_01_FULL_39_8b]|uniref:Methyltransferase type 11 domain-containing protein n=1 Tax=Candidatus Yanofskybacteria bacterium RIFCSPHIGHO2_01_FULL_39_8b TaxID=1802659 RepID=A0A1F8EHL9_9BACT|nr:hypothetical protein [uncultured bacterium]OGM99545.1 MAG: hypothetical protein A2817_01155 [Candidatus Yanofskybacteria bacterium RIFCSPHIGHO2_01_FULL_39_8b]
MISEKEVVEYYDKIYNKKGINAMRPLDYYRQVFAYLGTVPGKNLLDVGTGTGHILRAAQEAGLKIYGTDISPEAIRVAKDNVPDANLTVAAGENLPFSDNFFNYVVCFGSLEHFLDMNKGINEMIRVAKPEARFMIVVPNRNYFLWRFRGEYGTKQQDLKETLMDYNEWKEFFKKNGLEVKNVYHDPWPWQSVKIFKHKNPWRIARRAFYRFVWLSIPLRYTYQFVFILQKI